MSIVETPRNYLLVNENGDTIHAYTKDVAKETIERDAKDYLQRTIR